MQTSFFGQTVDATAAKPAMEMGPVPAGWYPAMLTEIDVQQKDWGLLAKVTFTVTEGQFSGRKIFDNMTLTHNTSQQAHDIGQGRLKAWCDAIGISANLSSADPLLHKTVSVKVKVEQGNDYPDKQTGQIKKGREQNRIETFKAYGAPASQPTSPAPAQQQYAPAPQQYAPVQQQYQPAPQAQPQQYAAPAAPAPAAAGPRGPMPWEKRA